jgi:hypothetical protein
VTSIKVESWGGGAAGGGSISNRSGGGGGGGAYSTHTLTSLQSGKNVTVTIGTGGASVSTGKGSDGLESGVTFESVKYATAGGGIGGGGAICRLTRLTSCKWNWRCQQFTSRQQ